MKSLLVLALLLVSFLISASASAIGIGDRVIKGYSNNGVDALIGTVKSVLANGKATVSFDGYGTYDEDIDSLSKAYRCIENVCVGDTFIIKGKDPFFDTKVRIVEFFENLQVEVEDVAFVNSSGEHPLAPSSFRTFYDISDLGVKINCEIDALPPHHSCSLRE